MIQSGEKTSCPSETGVRHTTENKVLFSGPSPHAANRPIASKTDRPSNPAAGLLLMDCSLNPISCNEEAIRILSYPDVPENIRRLDVFFADIIRARLLTGRSPQDSRFVTELVSGKRRYRCRVFHLNRHIRGPAQPALELLFERGLPGSLFLPSIARQFSFSQREQQAVEFLLQGLSSKQIADRMKISPNTVNTFFRLIKIKMGVSRRSGILAKIIKINFPNSIFGDSLLQGRT